MKKFSFSIAFALFLGAIAFSPVQAQDDPKAEFERKWYDSCQVKRDDQCIPLCKELLEKYPSSTYAKFAKQKLDALKLNTAWEKFQNALKAYYSGPDTNKLEQLFTAGDEFVAVEPDQQNPYHLFAVAQVALAGHGAALSQIYKNYDKVKGYAERAISEMAAATVAPEKFKAEYPTLVDPLRELVPANMNQFLAYRLIETKGDQQQAIEYLTKATQVQGKDGAGWKDANNYWLRSNIHRDRYVELSAKYNALPDDQKTGDAGKELIKQVNEVIDKYLLPDYGRVVATATKPELKELREEAKKQFDSFWKYRTDAPEKSAQFLKAFEADPRVEAPAIPVKAETENSAGLTAPTAPTGGSNVKLSASGPGASTSGTKAGATNGSKATSTKKAAPAKGRKRRP